MDFIKTYEAVTSFVKRLVYVETSVRHTITIDGRLAGVGGVVTLAGSTDLPCISSIAGGWFWKCQQSISLDKVL
ncbi:hypothetical protein M153_3730007116 [Pseudoloma neurophilia]|uniref:Uncharacterized protein n=1 Tax=Pseudoloma neurophilia TaxID=146866 RepID=A0A0R0LXT9_9MICR|nr:hypothetical protein M153_3730007116 [Pseudoloma neurophilia]